TSARVALADEHLTGSDLASLHERAEDGRLGRRQVAEELRRAEALAQVEQPAAGLHHAPLPRQLGRGERRQPPGRLQAALRSLAAVLQRQERQLPLLTREP